MLDAGLILSSKLVILDPSPGRQSFARSFGRLFLLTDLLQDIGKVHQNLPEIAGTASGIRSGLRLQNEVEAFTSNLLGTAYLALRKEEAG